MRDDDYKWDWREERSLRHEVRRVYLFDPREPDIYRPRSEGFTFSQTEIQHLAIAYIVLTAAFTFLFTNGIFVAINYPEYFIYYLPLSLIAVGTAFICHELGHKFYAQKFGYWAEFRYDLMWLLMGLGMAALFGFLFVAPGAVYIAGNPTRTENGKISAAGPGINITIAALLVPIAIIFSSFIGFIFIISIVNLFIAGFNMIPGWIFDGAKIWRWDKGLYVVMWILIVGLAIFYVETAYHLFNLF